MVTAEFVDMSNYWSQLMQIDEIFDESLEYYSPAAWIKLVMRCLTVISCVVVSGT